MPTPYMRSVILALLALANTTPSIAQGSGSTQAVVSLENLPADMLRMHTGDGWMAPSRSPGSRVGVTRVAMPLQNCRQPADFLDLARVRANGFTVVDYIYQEAPAPGGYKQAAAAVLRPYRRVGTRLVNAYNPAEVDALTVSPGPWVLDVPVRGKIQRLGCRASWTMRIRVIGPKGVDPITGQRK